MKVNGEVASKHGDPAMYQFGDCRCEACTTAQRELIRNRKASR